MDNGGARCDAVTCKVQLVQLHPDGTLTCPRCHRVYPPARASRKAS